MHHFKGHIFKSIVCIGLISTGITGFSLLEAKDGDRDNGEDKGNSGKGDRGDRGSGGGPENRGDRSRDASNVRVGGDRDRRDGDRKDWDHKDRDRKDWNKNQRSWKRWDRDWDNRRNNRWWWGSYYYTPYYNYSRECYYDQYGRLVCYDPYTGRYYYRY